MAGCTQSDYDGPPAALAEAAPVSCNQIERSWTHPVGRIHLVQSCVSLIELQASPLCSMLAAAWGGTRKARHPQAQVPPALQLIRPCWRSCSAAVTTAFVHCCRICTAAVRCGSAQGPSWSAAGRTVAVSGASPRYFSANLQAGPCSERSCVHVYAELGQVTHFHAKLPP